MYSKNNSIGLKKIAYTGCLGAVSIISTEFGVIGVLPKIAAYYNIGINTAGLLLSAFALTIFLIGPFLVLLTSGMNRKKIMLWAISLFLISNILSAFAPPFWVLILLRIFPAILQPVFFSAAVGTIIRSSSKEQQHKLMGIIIGGIALAQVTVIPFSTYMSSIYGWQISFVIQGIISLIALTGIIAFIPSMPVKEKLSYGMQLLILRKPRFIISIVFNVLLLAAWFSTYSYFADYLGKVKMMNEQQVSYMLLLFGLTGVVANWFSGRLLSKNVVGTTAFFLSGTILLPLILHFSGENFYIQILAISLWGLMFGPAFLTAISYMIDAAPEAPEFANSLQSSFGNLGVSTGTIVGGWFIAKIGIGSIPWVGAGIGMLAVLTMVLREIFDKLNKKKTAMS